VASLQITGASPTNGAVWIATNTTGQGKWSLPVGFSACIGADFIFSNATERTISWGTEEYDYGNNFNGTIFIAPVNGVYSVSTAANFSNVSGGGTSVLIYYSLRVNNVVKLYGFPIGGSSGNEYVYFSRNIYLTNNSPVSLVVSGAAGSTNKINTFNNQQSSFCITLIREIP
jgi:hypothetical protein